MQNGSPYINSGLYMGYISDIYAMLTCKTIANGSDDQGWNDCDPTGETLMIQIIGNWVIVFYEYMCIYSTNMTEQWDHCQLYFTDVYLDEKYRVSATVYW